MSEFSHDPRPSPQLRQHYLAALEEPQEFFLEELVGSGQVWTHDGESYGVINGQSLVEFFSADAGHTSRLLLRLHDQRGFATALVKSFDRDVMRACQALGWTGSVGGFLFRKRKTRTATAFHDAEIRAADPSDVEPLWQINEDFFESHAEIAALAETEKLWIARVDGDIAGCGVSNRFFEDSNAVDVGMMVARRFRRRGLGTHIVSEIANRIETAGLRPICGCGASNIASKATLEKAGFVTEHDLLSFTV